MHKITFKGYSPLSMQSTKAKCTDISARDPWSYPFYQKKYGTVAEMGFCNICETLMLIA